MAQSTLTKINSTPGALPDNAMGKRPDIQGLRAIAVLAVVFDHLLHRPTGGFVGVDIFFVISGFLITGLLLREHDRTGTISFGGFYRRRIRRIMPAALTVLGVTSAAAFFIFNVARARETSIDAIWGLFFSANWHFAEIGTDYFQAGGPVSPLQHFWSLAVEEQFYFIWPWLMLLILWLSGRARGADEAKGRKAIAILMAAIVVCSFAWALFESTANPTSAYFSTFTRTWELGLGALVAVIGPAFRRIPAMLRPVLAWMGMAGITWSVFSVTADMPFPAPWAAAPVVSTALVIIAGTGGEQRHFWPLTGKVAGYLGDISYSLYLWHFPVIVVTLTFFAEETLAFYGTAVAAMFALSVTSFHLIEEPIRRSEWLLPKTRRSRNQQPTKDFTRYKYAALSALAIATAVMCAAALLRSAPQETALAADTPAPLATTGASVAGNPVDNSPQGRLSAEIAAALAASSFPDFNPAIDTLGIENWAKSPEISCINVSSSNIDSCVTGSAEATKTAAVLGDSFAAAWLPGIRAALEPLGYKVQALTLGQCPAAAVAVDMEGGASFPACSDHQQWAIDVVRATHPDLTILASAQGSTMRRLASGKVGRDAVDEISSGLDKTVKDLVGNTGRVAVLSSPADGKSMQECVTKLANPGNCVSELTDDWKALTDAEKKVVTAAKMEYVETASWFCNPDGYCPGFVGDIPVRVDTGHMTVEYSQKLAPVLALALK
jgi:peptidoglycan/LPS O-acetylase OafA/YrhL